MNILPSVVYDLCCMQNEKKNGFKVKNWFFDSINNKIKFSHNEEKTKQLNSVLEKIQAMIEKNTINQIKFFKRKGKEYIYLTASVPESDELKIYEFEMIGQNCLLKKEIENSDVKACAISSDNVIVAATLNGIIIYDHDHVYTYDNEIKSLFRKINKNTFYTFDDKKIFLYKVENNLQIKEWKTINVERYGEIEYCIVLKEKNYITIRNINYILVYDTKNNKLEIESSIDYRNTMSKLGNLLFFCNNDSNDEPIILSQKPNIKNIGSRDINFYFV